MYRTQTMERASDFMPYNSIQPADPAPINPYPAPLQPQPYPLSVATLMTEYPIIKRAMIQWVFTPMQLWEPPRPKYTVIRNQPKKISRKNRKKLYVPVALGSFLLVRWM